MLVPGQGHGTSCLGRFGAVDVFQQIHKASGTGRRQRFAKLRKGRRTRRKGRGLSMCSGGSRSVIRDSGSSSPLPHPHCGHRHHRRGTRRTSHSSGSVQSPAGPFTCGSIVATVGVERAKSRGTWTGDEGYKPPTQVFAGTPSGRAPPRRHRWGGKPALWAPPGAPAGRPTAPHAASRPPASPCLICQWFTGPSSKS